MADIGNISVKVEADLKRLRASLDRMEQEIRKSAKRAEVELGKPFEGAANKLAKFIAKLGAIEGVFRATTAMSKLFKGDLAGAADEAERLPLGIGSAFAAARDLKDEVTGANEALERANRLSEEMARKQELAAEAVAQRNRNRANQVGREVAQADRSEVLAGAELGLRARHAEAIGDRKGALNAKQLQERAALDRSFRASPVRNLQQEARVRKALEAAQAAEKRALENELASQMSRNIMRIEQERERSQEQRLEKERRATEKLEQMRERELHKRSRQEAMAARRKSRYLDEQIAKAVEGLQEPSGVLGAGQFRAVEAGRFAFGNNPTFRKPIDVRLAQQQLNQLLRFGLPGVGAVPGL